MSGELSLRNRQRTRPVDLPLLRRLIRDFLSSALALVEFDLTVHLVNAREMTRLNETHLQHEGSTDVITFDYSTGAALAGEIFVCLDEALIQARRFRTTWQSEMVRYIIHGTLHLQGHDDLSPLPRRKMKKEEARLLKQMSRHFPLSKLRRKSKLSV
jgi:rRNA maturation RNase YbeY